MYERILNGKFHRYIQEKNLQYGNCQQNGRWSSSIFWSPDFEQTQPGHGWKTFRNKLQDLSEKLKFPSSCLIQFWSYLPDSEKYWDEPEDQLGHVPDNDKIWFVSAYQPFILSAPEGRDTICEKLCSYRMSISEKTYWHNEQHEEVFVVARVFRNKRMEFTPDVCYYTNDEYPQRVHAIPFYVKGSVTIPLAGFLGVMEIVWMKQPDDHFWPKDIPDFVSALQESDMIYPVSCINLCGQYDNKLLGDDVSEINEVLKVLGRTCDPVLAQTWILCERCNSLSTPQRVDCKLRAHHIYHSCYTDFFQAQSLCTLQKGKGVVGKAALHQNLVFCEDVAELIVSEYPLAHFARRYNLSACLAVCLSSNRTGQVYVLELFLPSSCLKGDGPIVKLVTVLEEIRKKCQIFNIAYGDKKLSVRMIDEISPYEHDSSKSEIPALMDYETIGLNSTATIENAITTTSLEKKNIIQDSAIESADAPGVLEMEDGSVRTGHSEQGLSIGGRIVSISESSASRSKRTREKGRIPITRDELNKCILSGKSREDAANDLNVSVSTLKRICREFDIARWPHKRKGSRVTIKAKYDDKFMQFELPKASGIAELNEQVSKRLRKAGGRYSIQFQDGDGNWFPLACDDDLSKYISISKGLGNSFLQVSVERAAELS